MKIDELSQTIEHLVQRVIDDKVSVSITIEPDRAEIFVSPWEPYQTICPYGKKKEGD